MRPLAALLAVLFATPAFAQPGVVQSPIEPFRTEVFVGVSGAYYGGPGIDADLRLARHAAVRLGVGITQIDTWRQLVDVGGRATLLGSIGDPRLELQGGLGGTASYSTVSVPRGQGAITRQMTFVPHVYAGVRTVLAFGDTPDGTPAPAPHLALRAGGMVTVDEPGRPGPTVRPEIGVGISF